MRNEKISLGLPALVYLVFVICIYVLNERVCKGIVCVTYFSKKSFRKKKTNSEKFFKTLIVHKKEGA